MPDKTTIATYDARADDYARMLTRSTPDQQLLDFMELVVPGGKVLDLGAGPGQAAGIMAARGFAVDAWDMSTQMLRRAEKHPGVTATHAGFDDLEAFQTFDGIWANFSLLHANRDDFQRHLDAVHRALRPGGAFHIGMKIGSGSGRDKLGRFYTYYDQTDLSERLTRAGFKMKTVSLGSGSGLAGDVSPWITVLSHA